MKFLRHKVVQRKRRSSKSRLPHLAWKLVKSIRNNALFAHLAHLADNSPQHMRLLLLLLVINLLQRSLTFSQTSRSLLPRSARLSTTCLSMTRISTRIFTLPSTRPSTRPSTFLAVIREGSLEQAAAKLGRVPYGEEVRSRDERSEKLGMRYSWS